MMTKIAQVIGFLVAPICAHITGHAIWILSLINLVWLLLSHHTLFTWWYIGFDATAFVITWIVILTTLSHYTTYYTTDPIEYLAELKFREAEAENYYATRSASGHFLQ
jgi:hypothetical protein